MKKLKIGVIDLVSKGPSNTLWARIMHANLASIMPQVVGTWCEEFGHEVTFSCYTGTERIDKELPDKYDIVFICAFSQAAFLAYAISNFFQRKGAVTVLGGPHARCYPDDSIRYFDYVLGMTNKSMIRDLVDNYSAQRPGVHISAKHQTTEFPGVKQRWKFIEPTLKKAPFLKIVPMMASVGCPYTCSFCIDATVPYHQLSFDVLKEDLNFLLTKFKAPVVGWEDPNFGVRFNETMDAIAQAAPVGRFQFIAESSLSILTRDHLKVMRDHNFKALLPGIESWYDMGNKSMAAHLGAEQKLQRVADHVNMVLEYVPYIQTNFVLGLDCDSGSEPFELTKRFIDNSPGAFPGYSLLTSFGEAAPINLEYQKEGRVLPLPFHFLNNHLAMNLKPKNYEWIDFYKKVIDLTEYTFSPTSIYRRMKATPNFTSKWMNVMRAISNEGYGRIRFYKKILNNLKDPSFRDYFEGVSDKLPDFYKNIIQDDLGPWMAWLPEGALTHNQNAYLHKSLGVTEKVKAGKSTIIQEGVKVH